MEVLSQAVVNQGIAENWCISSAFYSSEEYSNADRDSISVDR